MRSENSRFCEVHNEESVFTDARVLYSEVKPLLVPTGVSVNLHIQPIITSVDSISLK
jgi:hypothetical protein